jgi:hypothetical protein
MDSVVEQDILHAGDMCITVFRNVVDVLTRTLHNSHSEILSNQKECFEKIIDKLSIELTNKDSEISALTNAAIEQNLEIIENRRARKEAEIELTWSKSENSDLQKALVKVHEEIASFKKVSQLIAYERQNVKLQAEVMTLKDQLERRKHSLSQFSSVDCEEVRKVNKDDEVQPDKPEDQLDVQVYEKNINKRSYYVSDNEAMVIYEKEENGDIGQELGRLIKDQVTGKLKPIWT